MIKELCLETGDENIENRRVPVEKNLSWVRNSQTIVEIEQRVEISQHKVKLLHRREIQRGIAYKLSLQTYLTKIKDYQLAFEQERHNTILKKLK